jgi:hypothetical protein
MPNIWIMLIAYSLAFGFQNDKAKPLTDLLRKIGFFDRMLSCTYCTGFHCGWMVWLGTWAMTGTLPADGWHILPSILMWSFCSAGSCYVIDAVVQYLEVTASSHQGA